MRRLHHGLRNAGIDSKILSLRKGTKSPFDVSIEPSKVEKKLNSFIGKVTAKAGLNGALSLNSFPIKRNKAFLEADVINIHRIYQLFSYLALPSLTANKPTVLTLCDMWAFTGHCYHSLDCERWKTGCGKCPYPNISPSIRRDNTRLEWQLKNWAYRHSNLTIVVKTQWVADLVKQSMLSHFPLCCIPNGIDTTVYKPLDPEESRTRLGVPPDKKVLMFGAKRLDRFIKGGNFLLEALQSLPKSLKNETVLLLIGHQGEAIADAVDIPVINLGFVRDEDTKVAAFSAADLFLFPSRAEIFGNVAIESMACGTPVVAFRVAGIPELVRPGLTGYLAEPNSASGLRDGIVELLEDEDQRSRMSKNCRDIAVQEYALELWIQRYIDLYRQLLPDGIYQTGGLTESLGICQETGR